MRSLVGGLILAVLLATGAGVATWAAQEPQAPETNAFRVAVITATRTIPTQEHFDRVFARANVMLTEKTGERMVVVDRINAGPGNPIAFARAYLTANGAKAPDGIIVLSDDEEARRFGAYSVSVERPAGSTNRFPSPDEGADRVYVSVVDLFKVYQRCGYDAALERVSLTSRRGECRGQVGVGCVNNGQYWMCPNAVTDLHAEPDYFMACAVVHEFLHPFGELGDGYYYNTSACRARTWMSQEDASNLRLEQQSCGMCPDMYSKFRRAPTK